MDLAQCTKLPTKGIASKPARAQEREEPATWKAMVISSKKYRAPFFA